MLIATDYTASDLRDKTWDCEYFWEKFDELDIPEEDKENRLFGFLADQFSGTPEITEVNDLLRFEADFVISNL